MPKAFTKGLREDVIRTFRDSDASVAQVAKAFAHLAVVPQALAHHRRQEVSHSISGRSGSQRVGRLARSEQAHQAPRIEQENEVLRRAAAYLSQANQPGK